MPMCVVIIVSIVECCAQLWLLLSEIFTHIGDCENVCVASESCQIFPRDQSVHLRKEQHRNAKNPDYEM